jgi:hypothetical protein
LEDVQISISSGDFKQALQLLQSIKPFILKSIKDQIELQEQIDETRMQLVDEVKRKIQF